MYTVICDNCGKDSNADADYSAWSDADFARDTAIEDDWMHEDGKDYCKSCWYWDDNDDLQIREIKKS